MNALSEARIRHAETPTTIKKLSDGQGLVLLLHPNGSKYWRFNYRFNKKQKTLAIGKYPNEPFAKSSKCLGEDSAKVFKCKAKKLCFVV